MRRFLRFLTTVTMLAIAGYIASLLMPKSRERTRSTFFRASPRKIYDAILDIDSQKDWRSDLKDLHIRRKRRKWTETLRGNIDIEYQITRTEPEELIEMAFFSDLGFSGKKSIEIIEHDDGANVTFTESVNYDRWYVAALACLVNLFDLEMERYVKDLKSYVEGNWADNVENARESKRNREEDEENEDEDEEEEKTEKRSKKRHG